MRKDVLINLRKNTLLKLQLPKTCLLLCIIFLCSCNSSGIGVGRNAPDFLLTEITGRRHQLKAYQGSVVLLHFWASWCGTCMEEMPDFVRLAHELKPKGLAVVSISLDEEKQGALDAIKRFSIDFPVLWDEKYEMLQVASEYNAQGLPVTYIIDRNGKFVLFPDLDGSPTIKLVGGRPWSNDTMKKPLLKILETK